ncbi:hypothetical protein GQ43DRAFT_443989 [Delitschia confertaspora ATCC 74209]|uniref:Uncharacterized protein n=1 Tax=Delitschia confertaspora ATCC 74209 TaxID=1513339 RepID=A0A9P4JIB6_9PLEO|nr:hypothetical protein GQ43DRAFT_443989 [Delitschia confertaspora ATCC 74209]
MAHLFLSLILLFLNYLGFYFLGRLIFQNQIEQAAPNESLLVPQTSNGSTSDRSGQVSGTYMRIPQR